MSLILRLTRCFTMLPSIYKAGQFAMVPPTLFSILLLVLAVLSGCAGNENISEVRTSTPIRTATFETPYEALATCAKQRIESSLWPFGEPGVHWKREKGRQMIRVYAMYSRSTLFDVTFEEPRFGVTAVEYRQGYDGYGIRDQTWGIILSCAQEVRAPVN